MNKKIVLLIAILLSTVYSFGQAKMSDWAELKAYHTVISQTFHPSEEGNLAPIKSRAQELSAAAHKLSGSAIPASFNNDKVKAAVAKLEKESDRVYTMVAAKETDERIKKQLGAVHDAFHEIVGLCRKDDK